MSVTLDVDAQARSLLVQGTFRTRPTEPGEYREAWTKLYETADAGTTAIVVRDGEGWRSGDRVVLTPTGRAPSEFEERRIVSVAPHDEHLHVTLDAPLTYGHHVIEAPEIDRSHHGGRVRYAGEVLNLSRRLTLRLATELTVSGGTLALDDLHVNATLQINDSADGGVLRRVVGEGGAAGQFQTENTQNLLWEECIAYDYTTVPSRGGGGFGWSEKSGKGTARAHNVWCVRCVAAAKRSPTGSLSNGRTKGFTINGLGGNHQTTARGGIVGSIAVGCPGGTEGAGFRFSEGGVHGLQYFWLNEAHSCARGLYVDGNNMIVQPDGLPYVSGFFWRNVVDGMFWGAYSNHLEMHHFHFLGNGKENVKVQNRDVVWGRFVLDGEGVTPVGVHLSGYITVPTRHAEYLRTRFRNHTAVSISIAAPGTKINRFLDFPAADFSGERVPRTDFCRFSAPAIPQPDAKRALIGEDVLRFDDQLFRHGACPAQDPAPAPLPWDLPVVDQTTGESGTRKTITAPRSRYSYEAFVQRVEQQPRGGINPASGEALIRPLEDWTMVREIELSPPQFDGPRRRRVTRP